MNKDSRKTFGPKSLSYASALHPRPMTELFSPITPYSQGFLPVGGDHMMYWEQSGNLDGIPILVLHGGPGAGATPTHRRFFDPATYRIIIYDQRGCGRSHPLGSVTDNTLPHLVKDIEKLRAHLNIPRWHVFGGSWGSTLALSYAVEHPDRCTSMILRSIFLLEQSEIDWFMQGMQVIFPEAWENFAKFIPQSEHHDLLGAYYKRLTGDNADHAMAAALAWNAYESACASFFPQSETIVGDDHRAYALAMTRIEAHYFKTQVLTPENSLLDKIDRIRAVPAVILNGRYDIICPMTTANKLHQAWPEADFIIVPDSGHSFLDPTMRSRLIEATENAKTIRSL